MNKVVYLETFKFAANARVKLCCSLCLYHDVILRKSTIIFKQFLHCMLLTLSYKIISQDQQRVWFIVSTLRFGGQVSGRKRHETHN